jgi:hypothetical protein
MKMGIDWENMSKEKKRFIVAMMIASEHTRNMGVLVDNETKIMIGEKVFRYEGTKTGVRVREGDITEFGLTEKEGSPYEVLEANTKENKIVLRSVSFFKAKVTTKHHTLDEFCVVAEDRENAFKILKKNLEGKHYTRVVSMNPVSKIFEPVVK